MVPAYLDLYTYTVEGLTRGDPLIKVGGPAQSGPSSTYAVPVLIKYCRDNNIKLDFISYHRYANDTDYGGSFANANSMRDFHRAMVQICSDNGFTGELLDDEWGPTYSTDKHRDNEISASFIAKTIHLIGTDTVAPPVMYGYWTISDLYEEFNTGTTTAFHDGMYGLLLKGDPLYPDSYDLEKAAFNSFKLLHMMGDARVAASGGTTGDGVNLAATLSADSNTLQVLVYNHVNGANADSTIADNVSLTLSNIPFAPGQAKVEHYLIDRTHSNAYQSWIAMGRPSQPNEAQWATLKAAAALAYRDPVATVSLTGSSWSKSFTQNVYSVSLIVLSGSGTTSQPTATPISTPAPTAAPTGALGDVNGNGAVDIVDALLVAQYYVGLNPASFIASNADANCDGSITIVDALLIAQRYVGLTSSFTC